MRKDLWITTAAFLLLTLGLPAPGRALDRISTLEAGDEVVADAQPGEGDETSDAAMTCGERCAAERDQCFRDRADWWGPWGAYGCAVNYRVCLMRCSGVF